MKLKTYIVALTGLMNMAAFAADEPANILSTDQQKVAYSIGVDLGRNMKKQGLDLDANILAKGLTDGFNGGPLLLTDDKMKEVLTTFQKEFVAKRNAEIAKMAEANLAQGQKFLEENKKQKDVVTTASGLQYKVITAGTGEKPSAEDSVTVEYTGKLINGKVFDSSEKQGHPITFKVNQVIPGWTEALQLMPAGSTWELYIPSNLAYGPQAVGTMIGPNETLIFNVHLVSAQKASK